MKILIKKTKVILPLFLIAGIISLCWCKIGGKNATIEESNSRIKREYLVGSWEDTSKSALHFTLFEDGTARSDNMKTLVYKNWKLTGTQITFSIESIGNGTSGTDDETYIIERLTKDELVLRRGTGLSDFKKKNK